ncbi:hypothetical protein BGX26_004370, partial [Mortierella sp. AD094]
SNSKFKCLSTKTLLMSFRMVGTRISAGNSSARGILRLLANWNKSSSSGVARAYAPAQTPLLPWIHNRVNPRHQFPVASIIRQFTLAPTLPLKRATVATSDKTQYQYKGQQKEKENVREPRKFWTLEEDIILYNCLQENKPTADFCHQFPGRSMHSVGIRAYRLRNAYFVPPEKGGLVEDPDMSVAQRVEALRRIMHRYTVSESKAEGFYAARTKSTHMNYTRPHVPFSEEEKEMLAKLVYKYRHDPEMWARVSGGRLVDEEGAPRLNRPAMSCMAAWKTMNRDESNKVGRWDKHERQRLVKAIKGQVGSEYKIYLDVKKGGPDESNQSAATSGWDTRPALRMGSPVLQGLDWEKIAKKVRSRTAIQCRNRFYRSTHNGETGNWGAEEVELLLEGYELGKCITAPHQKPY